MSLSQSVRQLVRELQTSDRRVVFAESCTGGLVAASLAAQPGISNHLCGSAVTYRDDTKHHWLQIPQKLIQSAGAVSAEVAESMARGVLNLTPEADLSGSITGHLGPDAPVSQDGLCFVGVACRGTHPRIETRVVKYRLHSRTRVARQREAAKHVLTTLLAEIRQLTPKGESS